MRPCPRCRSPRVASRRQLFLCLMNAGSPLRGFEWYHRDMPAAMPPKSLFVQLLSVTLLCTVPLLLLHLNQPLSAQVLLTALATAGAAALGCLCTDILLTYRKYRDWAGKWICADCRSEFRENLQIIPIS